MHAREAAIAAKLKQVAHCLGKAMSDIHCTNQRKAALYLLPKPHGWAFCFPEHSVSTYKNTHTCVHTQTHICACRHNIHDMCMHAYVHTFPQQAQMPLEISSLKRGRRHALSPEGRSQKKPVFVSSGPAGMRCPWSHSSALQNVSCPYQLQV